METKLTDELVGKVFDLVDEESGYISGQHNITIAETKVLVLEELISQLKAKLSYDEDIKIKRERTAVYSNLQ